MPDPSFPTLAYAASFPTLAERRRARETVARYGPGDHLRLRGEARIQGVTFPPGSPVRVMSHRAYSVEQQYEVEILGPDGNTVEFNTSERALDHLVERYVERQHWTHLGLVLQGIQEASAVRTPEVLPVPEPAVPARTAWQWLDEDAV